MHEVNRGPLHSYLQRVALHNHKDIAHCTSCCHHPLKDTFADANVKSLVCHEPPIGVYGPLIGTLGFNEVLVLTYDEDLLDDFVTHATTSVVTHLVLPSTLSSSMVIAFACLMNQAPMPPNPTRGRLSRNLLLAT